MLGVLLAGCATRQSHEAEQPFTSGSREADQRAEQRVAKTQLIRGQPEGENGGGGGDKNQQGPARKALYERLGSSKGLETIVNDFVDRVIADPRVNWERKGVKGGGWLGTRPVEWKPDADRVANLKKHLAQFLALATGGPTIYEGRDIKEVHRGMRITNAEFDAAVGDLQASLDKFGVATDAQKELLAIVESTRPQVVEQR
jgi:hemoglobin